MYPDKNIEKNHQENCDDSADEVEGIFLHISIIMFAVYADSLFFRSFHHAFQKITGIPLGCRWMMYEMKNKSLQLLSLFGSAAACMTNSMVMLR